MIPTRPLYTAFGLLLSCVLVGCEQKLPGPLECEKLAFSALGRSQNEAAYSPKVRRLSERLIQGCLTVPFDKQALACVADGRSFLSCVDDLARRAPQTKPALTQLLLDVGQLRGR